MNAHFLIFFTLLIALWGCHPFKVANVPIKEPMIAQGKMDCIEKWWMLFDDALLNRLMEVALGATPTIDAIAERFKNADLFYHEKKPLFISFGKEDFFTDENALNIRGEIDNWQKKLPLSGNLAEKEAYHLLTASIACLYYDFQFAKEREENVLKFLQAIEAFSPSIKKESLIRALDVLGQEKRRSLSALEVLTLSKLNLLEESQEEQQFHHPFPLPSSLPLEILAAKSDFCSSQAIHEVNISYSILVKADEAMKAINQSLYESLNNYFLTFQKFNNGASNHESMFQVLQKVFNHEDKKALVELSKFKSAIFLMKALGGSYYQSG